MNSLDPITDLYFIYYIQISHTYYIQISLHVSFVTEDNPPYSLLHIDGERIYCIYGTRGSRVTMSPTLLFQKQTTNIFEFLQKGWPKLIRGQDFSEGIAPYETVIKLYIRNIL